MSNLRSPTLDPLDFHAEHVMIDLETLSMRMNTAIISIGAVHIRENAIVNHLYLNVSIDDQLKHGAHVSDLTFRWWLQQSNAARSYLCEPEPVPFRVALGDFEAFFPPEGFLWGNGAGFDNAVLSNAFMSLNHKRPWHYRADMCYRTLRSMWPTVLCPEVGDLHNALDDATAQGKHLIRLLMQQRAMKNATP